MKYIITILLSATCLSSFAQDSTTTKVETQDKVFYTKPSDKTVTNKKKSDDGYKLVEPKANSAYADYKLVEPMKYAYVAQSKDSVYYEHNSIQYYPNENNTADDNEVTPLYIKRAQLQYAQANTYLTYNTVKFLQAAPMH